MRHLTASLLATAALAVAVIGGCSATLDRDTTGEALDDGAITQRVTSQLLADPTTGSHQIGVTTFNGSVQLRGVVDSVSTRDHAAAVAKEVVGVEQVANSLQVRSRRS